MGVKRDTYFLTVPDISSQDQGGGMVGFFRGLSPWLVDSRISPVSSHGLPSVSVS